MPIDREAVYPAFPCRAASVWGDGWLALGDAAVALDPISGQGVTSALEMAERVAEVVEADPGLGHLGPLYGEALDARFETHLAKRQEVYEDAEEVFGSDMLERLIGVPRSERRSVRMAREGHRRMDQSWSRSMP